VQWGRRFLADRATWPIAPGLKITAPEAEKLQAGLGRRWNNKYVDIDISGSKAN
jgi:hypothetical protein